MKEITTMPVRVQNGNKEIEVYEWEEGFAMTTEFLGKRIGYKRPKDGMAYLFKRNKSALDSHRFAVTVTANPIGNKLASKPTYSDRDPHRFVAFEGNKPQGGRPTNFYDAEGCIIAIGLAGTPRSKEFLPQIITYLKYLEKKRMERIETYWFGKRPFWPEIRDRVMKGESFREISEAIGRSAASVRNAVSRMIEVGILQPLRAAQALTGTARKTVLRYHRKFTKDDRQLHLFNHERSA